MMKKVVTCAILFCCIMLTACNNIFKLVQKPYAKISWIDFIQFNDITYAASYDRDGLKLTKDDLDKELYRVKFNVAYDTYIKSKDTESRKSLDINQLGLIEMKPEAVPVLNKYGYVFAIN